MPSDGSPLGTDTGPVEGAEERGGLDGLEGDLESGSADLEGIEEILTLFLPPGSVLHRWTRSLRLANLSRSGSRERISSTHSRSCTTS